MSLTAVNDDLPAIVVAVVKGSRVGIFAGAMPTLVTAVVKALP